MIVETIYRANDGIAFKDQNECLKYEADLQKTAVEKIADAVVTLDEIIWKKYHPEYSMGSLAAPLDQAHVWLKNDIGVILSHTDKDLNILKEEILEIIKAHTYGAEIMKRYVPMEALMEEALIRRDFGTAFSKVQQGSALSRKLGWSLGPKDLKKLALLHQEKKYRKKIEDLLTDCNFHYECGKFTSHDYEEFLIQKKEGRRNLNPA